jgi:hypothetical protein
VELHRFIRWHDRELQLEPELRLPGGLVGELLGVSIGAVAWVQRDVVERGRRVHRERDGDVYAGRVVDERRELRADHQRVVWRVERRRPCERAEHEPVHVGDADGGVGHGAVDVVVHRCKHGEHVELHGLQDMCRDEPWLGQLQRDGDDGDAEPDAFTDERCRWLSGFGDRDVLGDG